MTFKALQDNLNTYYQMIQIIYGLYAIATDKKFR